MHHLDGHDVCRIHVDPCGFPVEATVVHDKNGQHVKTNEFYVRILNTTVPFDGEQRQLFIRQRWG